MPIEPERRRRWLFPVATAIVVFATVGIAAIVLLTVSAGSILMAPGSLHETEGAVRSADNAKVHADDTEIWYPTVSVREAKLFDTLIRSRFDPTLEFESEEEVYGGQPKATVDHQNAELMNDSKMVAQYAAEEFLGFDPSISGKGALVLNVLETAPSADVLKSGDVITSLAGKEIAVVGDIASALKGTKPGETVAIKYNRDDKPGSATIELDAASDDPKRPIVGIEATIADPKMNLPIKLDLDSGDVTGPSAGLAWTLAIIDRLQPGDLNEGVDVAATGTIALNGDVGPIGGLPQKATAVRRAGVDVFLVPADTPKEDLAAAEAAVDGEVKIVKVATIAEAVAQLSKT